MSKLTGSVARAHAAGWYVYTVCELHFEFAYLFLLITCTVVLFTGWPKCHTVFSRVVVPPTLSYLTSTITRLIPLYQCMWQLFSCHVECVADRVRELTGREGFTPLSS